MIALAALSQSCAIVCGLIVGPICLWLATRKLLYACGGILLGGLIGLAIGFLTGRLLFQAGPDSVAVIKAGTSAFLPSLKASLTAAVLTALSIATVTSLFSNGPLAGPFLASGGVAIVVGLAWAYLAANL